MAESNSNKYRLFPDYAAENGYVVTKKQAEVFKTRLVSVDPGGAHVGVAVFGLGPDGWVCLWAGEMTPLDFEDWLSKQYALGTIDILVVEEFVLFNDKALEQSGSDMPTSQLIGVIKYIHRVCKDIAARWPHPDAQLYFQSPQIKKPTLAVLKNRGYASMAKKLKAGGHALDAELHGYHHIIKTLDEPVVPLA